MARVLVKERIAEGGLELLRRDFDVDFAPEMSREEMLKHMEEYDALIVRSATRVDSEVIEAGKNLKVIGRAGVGVDNIDMDAATKRGIMVINAPQSNIISAAEHTMALLLALCRYVPDAVNSLREKCWDRTRFEGVELYHKVMGIVGLGRIGTLVAHRCLSFGMQVVAYDPYVSEEKARKLGVELASSLDDLLAQADFVTVHLPKTPETYHILGEREFAKMKDGVRIINVARGGLVDEEALLSVLESGKVAGAALDVFGSEPLRPGHPLLELDSVVLTPHLGASTHEAQVNVALQTAAAVLAVLRGEPVTTAVNIPVPTAEESRELAPFFPLAEVLGRFGAQWSEGMIGRLHVAWRGRLGILDTRPLLNYVLKGFLSPLLHEQVNAVNAPLLAKERAIRVSELRAPDANDFPGEIVLTATTNRGERVVAGSLSARHEPRLVQIDDYRIDVAPVSYMLVCPHVDQPGIIGMVGTILGKAGVNISGMQVARQIKGGDAIMILGVDCPLTLEAVTQIARMDGVLSVKQIYLQ